MTQARLATLFLLVFTAAASAQQHVATDIAHPTAPGLATPTGHVATPAPVAAVPTDKPAPSETAAALASGPDNDIFDHKNVNPFSLDAFRGSTLWYTHSVTAITLDKGAEPTWNPTWSHRLSFRPVWQFWKYLHVSARFDLNQELTNADDTTYEWQVMPSDLSLEVGGSYTEPHTKIQMALGLRIGLPTSLASRAESMILSLGPTLNVSRTIPLLKGLSLSYFVRWSKYFRNYDTATYQGSTIPCGDPRAPSCEQFVQAGERSATWGIAHGPGITLAVTDKLSFDFITWFLYSQLFPLAPGTMNVSGGNPISLDSGNGVNGRLAVLTALDATYDIGRGIGVSVGAYTYSGEPGPDGLLRNPFVNRYTSLSVDLVIDVVSLIAGDPPASGSH